jgi:DNA-binding MarR family transcriptional regulator
LVTLTAAGRDTLAAINKAARSSNNAIQREFTPENVAHLRALLRQFTAIIKDAEST